MSDTPRRRDLLTTAAFSMAGVGLVAATWPLIAALQPAEDTIANRVAFDLTTLTGTKAATLSVVNGPVLIFRRTEEELSALRGSAMESRSPNSLGGGFRDRESLQPQQPRWAQNWHRSRRPEIMVMIPSCTRGDCLVRREDESREFWCPCCGSRFDLAGRATFGPAQTNLLVPDYNYIDDTHIEFPVAGRRPPMPASL